MLFCAFKAGADVGIGINLRLSGDVVLDLECLGDLDRLDSRIGFIYF